MSDAQHRRSVVIIGCGYVGTALARALVERDCDVVGTTRTPSRVGQIESTGARARLLTVQDAGAWRDELSDRQSVYLTIAAGRRDADYRDVYLPAAQNLAAALTGTDVSRIIYTSSTAVYGQTDGSEVDEHARVEPTSDNGCVLVETERALLDAAARQEVKAPVHVSVVRLGGIHGPRRELTSLARRFAGTTRDDGDAYVNLIHRDDIVAALVALQNVSHHGVLNLTDNHPVRRRDLYDPILTGAGLPPIQWQPSAIANRLGKRVNSRRICELLNLSPRPAIEPRQ